MSGAGPAGSKCAEVLSKRGFKVALIDRDISWRKPCGGAVHSRIFKYYPQLRNVNFHQISGIVMYSADYHQFKYKWKDTRYYGITVDRLEFDNFLRNIAIDAGAELFDKNLSIDFVTKNKRRIGIKTKYANETKEYLGKIIIVGDGMSSKLLNKLGLRKNIEELMFAKCAIMEGENNLDEDFMSIFFKSYKGYGWLFPLGDNKFNIGCGSMGKDHLKYNLNSIYTDFIKDSEIQNYIPRSDYKKIWEATYPLPALGVNEKNLYLDNLMIIGDAAGFVSPISGEGISPSVVSGNAAAEAAIYAIEEEDISNQTLKKYRFHPKVKKIIRNFKLNRYLADFFFEHKGRNISKMFELAQKDDDYREEVVDTLLFNHTPSKDFLLKLKY
ncbi:MAG TPA: NAD(P)/FAD-dependent oxidoreductase [archaeon]|nr:NAD(P)/FAD-dependent oxidoreductase [archaeon]